MHRGLLCLPLLAALACGDDLVGDTGPETVGSTGESTTAGSSESTSPSAPTSQPTQDTSGGMSGSETSTGAPTTSEPTTGTTGTTTGVKADMGGGDDFLRCHDDPPDGATLAPDIPAYGGTCPALEIGYMEGQAFNVLPQQLGNNTVDRLFLVIAPEDAGPDERLPVIFLWHWLGGEAKDFYDRGDVQNAVNQKRFIAVIPEAREDLLFKWPFSAVDSDADLQAEFQFFDDMLSCVAEQFNVNKDCVASTGVSAGALFTSQLAGGRGDVLSSFMSLSGGTGGGTIKPWTAPAHKMPAMVLWGGPNDFCIVIDFEQTSKDLEMNLEAGGHFVLECIHNCNHSTPPFPVQPGETSFAPLWDFFLDHPYWLAPGESPYNEFGIPAGMPDWCAIGVGNAVPPPEPCDKNECS
ncbi:hypothetical protein [Nannocystis sp. SCPEA4]|uniref:hypothetical protein n=1 Tax=Nannocystis sp. SCPEA4 TaxID=2996787 RepID=UPI00226D4C2F|nr:hypothetical protein [Nannocystis sp. SCPEA4]MCY1055188.1 hypothetical protein [Nannocystis sp. SCPEA4]